MTSPNQELPYHIGQANQPWGIAERQQWLSEQSIKRSYQNDVIDKLNVIANNYNVSSSATLGIEQYSALDFDPVRYPLLVFKSALDPTKPTALITGGVHGYETSGVHGAVRFIETKAEHYAKHFNLVVAPCISPWGYETINRWNPEAIDPNRSFTANSPAQESSALMAMVRALNSNIHVHIDLHETTDTDNSEFRPALSARDNVYHEFWEIPDGFYLVGDTENPCNDFQEHIIKAVAQVTHIAPSDSQGRIIGELTTQQGVINYATNALGLCTGFSKAQLNTTTEVYPDSPLVNDENCIEAQLMAICSGLDFYLSHVK